MSFFRLVLALCAVVGLAAAMDDPTVSLPGVQDLSEWLGAGLRRQGTQIIEVVGPRPGASALRVPAIA
jgi:hypothetical protein